MNVAVIIGKIDLKENVFTILAKNGTPIYIPIIIGIYHILVIDEFLNNNNSFIKVCRFQSMIPSLSATPNFYLQQYTTILYPMQFTLFCQ